MNTERQHEQIVAERAMQLLTDVQSGGVGERAALMRWIKQSPLHVREMLIATAWEKLLSALDIDRKINLDSLMHESRRTATPISEHRDLELDLVARVPVEFASIAAADPIDKPPAVDAATPHSPKSGR